MRSTLSAEAEALGVAIGVPLMLVKDDAVLDPNEPCCTALGRRQLGAGVLFEVIADIYFSDSSFWAIAFFYLNGDRVAPLGMDFLSLRRTSNGWVVNGWEADVYDEWAERRRMPIDSDAG